MKYDFDSYVERRNSASMKWDTYSKDVLPMWVADTDFRSPGKVADAIMEKAQKGIFGYPMGDEAFRNACAHWQRTRFGWDLDPGRAMWCPSLGVAIALCIRAFTDPGDGVAMLWPIYPPFMRLCKLNGRLPTGTTLKWQQGKYHIDFEELERVLARPATKLFLLCNPHNPTGRVFNREELVKIGTLCLAHNVRIFSDEIHEDIIYSGAHIPFPTLSPELASISVVGVNPSKTFNVADLRSAAIICEDETLFQKLKDEIQALKLGPCSLGLAGAARAWEDCADYADELVNYLRANAEHAVKYIGNECAPVMTYMPEATFLLWLDCRGLGLDSAGLERFFLDQARVGLNPGIDFGLGGEGFMRLNFGCPRSILDEGLGRIKGALRRRG